MKKLSIASIVGTAILALPLGLLADHHERPELSDVWLMMPKQGMQGQFEAAVKEHMAFRRDAGESRSWEAYGVALGSNPLLYQWRSGGLNLADQDAFIAEDMEGGYGQNWFANVDQYVDHYHHYMERSDYENSNWPADLEQVTYYGVTTWNMKQGAGEESNAARKQLSQIGIEAGWEYNWMWLTRVGGNPKLMIVSPYENFAAMADPDPTFFDLVTETLGSAEEAGKLFSQFSSGFSDSSYTVWQHRPDLSSATTSGADDD